MEVAVQVFGGVGLIETMMELAYVVSSRDYFNSFEGMVQHGGVLRKCLSRLRRD